MPLNGKRQQSDLYADLSILTTWRMGSQDLDTWLVTSPLFTSHGVSEFGHLLGGITYTPSYGDEIDHHEPRKKTSYFNIEILVV